MQRPAQEHNLALQLPALGEAGHGLIHHRLENGGGHVLFSSALIKYGLDVALGEHAAAGGDGINFFVLEGELIQLVYRHIHERGHLVDEGSGASGAGAVHPLLQRTAEKDDLGVLAAQLDDCVGVRDIGVHRGGGGVHLLHKVQPRSLGHAQAGGAGDHQAHVFTPQHIRDGIQSLAGPLPGLGVVPLVGAKQQLVLLVQHHYLDGGGADINADTQNHKGPPVAAPAFGGAALMLKVQSINQSSANIIAG